jgi:hypothetical protein
MIDCFQMLICTLSLAAHLAPQVPAVPDEKPAISYQAQDVEGWKVHVDKQLLEGPQSDLGKRALRVLAFKLYEIKQLVARDRLEKLQRVPIFLDFSHPKLKAMQYHPSVGWLKANGHDPALAKAVHVPQASDLVSRLPINQQPMVILHELAHAYHDQVLGFEEKRIQEAWARFKEGGKYEEVQHISGKPRRHYALTNPQEFFAEMTEAYFGTNDFYPFVRSELRKELPDVYQLLEEIWGGPSEKR